MTIDHLMGRSDLLRSLLPQAPEQFPAIAQGILDEIALIEEELNNRSNPKYLKSLEKYQVSAEKFEIEDMTSLVDLHSREFGEDDGA